MYRPRRSGPAKCSRFSTLSAAAIALLTVTALRLGRLFHLYRELPDHDEPRTRTAAGQFTQSQQEPAAEHAAAIASEEHDGHVDSIASAREDSEEEGRGVAIVVMPSPPMVSGPMTRIDRLIAIEQTWGQDFVILRRRGSVAGGIGLDSGNRLIFVMEEKDPFAPEAIRMWGVDDTSAKGRYSAVVPKSHPDTSERNVERKSIAEVLLVPTAISNDGKDGDARMRHVLATVARVYEPDFLFFCNEHTFVIADLLCFVEGLDSSEAVYLGNRFRKESPVEAMMNSGAAGFVLSRESLRLLRLAWGEHANDSAEMGILADAAEMELREGDQMVDARVQPECVAKTRFEKDNPGVTLARCLKHLGIEAQDTTDDQGGQRFNVYGPVRLAQGKIDQWYKDVHASKPGLWIAGRGCCSEETISFHYVGPAEARAMHQILHDRDNYREAFRAWPSSKRDLGSYSAALGENDTATSDLLLNKIKLCRRYESTDQ